MKVTLAIFFVLLLPNIGNSQSFTLTGTINWAKEGEAELSYILIKDGRISQSPFGKTLIKNSQFRFEGQLDNSQIMLLSLLDVDKQKHLQYMVFIENTDIQVKIKEQGEDDYFTFSGSENQYLFGKYLREADSLFYLIKESKLQPEVSQLNLFHSKQILKKIASENTLSDLYYMILYGSLKAIDPERYISFYKEVLKFAPQNKNSAWQKAFEYSFSNTTEQEDKRTKKQQNIYETIKAAELTNIAGKKVSISSLIEDKYAVILFLEDDCRSCKSELRMIEKLQKKYQKDKRVIFISIVANMPIDDWKEVIGSSDTNITNLLDKSGLIKKLNLSKIPHSYFLRPEGFGGSGSSIKFYLPHLLEIYLKN